MGSRVDSEGLLLPEGWFSYKSDGGALYYFHPESNVTQWDRPSASQRINRLIVAPPSSSSLPKPILSPKSRSNSTPNSSSSSASSMRGSSSATSLRPSALSGGSDRKGRYRDRQLAAMKTRGLLKEKSPSTTPSPTRGGSARSPSKKTRAAAGAGSLIVNTTRNEKASSKEKNADSVRRSKLHRFNPSRLSLPTNISLSSSDIPTNDDDRAEPTPTSGLAMGPAQKKTRLINGVNAPRLLFPDAEDIADCCYFGETPSHDNLRFEGVDDDTNQFLLRKGSEQLHRNIRAGSLGMIIHRLVEAAIGDEPSIDDILQFQNKLKWSAPTKLESMFEEAVERKVEPKRTKYSGETLLRMFFLTYKELFPPSDLMRLLVKYFSHCNTNMHNMIERGRQLLGIHRLLHLWIAGYSDDFKASGGERYFQSHIVGDKGIFSGALGDQLLDALGEAIMQGVNARLCKRLPAVGGTEGMTPRGRHLANDKGSKASWLSWRAVDIAKQLALLEFNLFKSIKGDDWLFRGWSQKNRATSIDDVLQHVNQMTMWFALTIVRARDESKRNKYYNKFIKVAKESVRLNNFATAMEILAALSMTAVSRLVSDEVAEPLKPIEELFSGYKRYANYRNKLKDTTPPCVPHLLIYIADFEIAEEAEPTVLKGTSLINVGKLNKLGFHLDQVSRFQKESYPFSTLHRLEAFLTHIPKDAKREDISDVLYQESLAVKSREPEGSNRAKRIALNEEDVKPAATATKENGEAPERPLSPGCRTLRYAESSDQIIDLLES